MLKDFIDCKNDATSKFLTDAPVTSRMSEETPSASPADEHVTTMTMDDVYEIECSSIAEEIIIEDVKCYESSSPESEIIEILDNDSVEELQSPIADEVDQLINNEHINSKHALENNEYEEFILPHDEPERSNDLMEIDTPFLNENSLATTNNVESESKELIENVPQSKPIELPIQPSASESVPLTSEVTDKPYKCHICGKLFSRNSSLKCHIRLHVEGPDSLLRGSSQPLNLKSHLEFQIKKEDLKKDEIIEPEVDLNASDVVPYDETATGVLNSSRDSNELADDDDKRDYKCIICEKTFSRKSSLTFHYKFHPKSPTSKSQDDITSIVGETINDETAMEVDPARPTDQYLRHLKLPETNVRRKSSDSNSLSTNLTDCIKDLDVDLTYDADVAVNHTDITNDAGNLFKCPHCPRSFPSIRGLRTHSSVHRKKLVDDQSKASETLSQIVYEEVSSRKYDCSKKLHNHNDQVTKLYKCNVCCKCFCDIGNLKRHLARDHKDEDTSEASDNDIVVSRKKSITAMNDSKLARKRANDDHPQKASVNLRGLYKCGVCNEAFDEIQSLGDHVAEHLKTNNDSMQSATDDSSAEELSCVVCEKTFRNQNSLSRHMNEHRRREEEIFVRVTSSGRKIRERRPSEDMSTTSPIKCIPCNRYFESIRAKRTHDSFKHHAEQPGPADPESDNDEDAPDDNTEEFICDCCNRPWATLRSLSIHKSWNKHKLSLASADKSNPDPLPVDDEDENEEMNSDDSDDYTAPEENKTENDVTSSVKCGCCNELFPNIPALNAHQAGQTNGSVADTSTLPDYERKDLTNCDSLRDLVKCDRCDKFCSSIPALKLHIISDHTKKSVPPSSTENSTVTASKPAAVSDRLKKNVFQNSIESSSSLISKSNIADRTKKHVSQNSMESSPAPKSQIISERKRSVSKSSSEIHNSPAVKYQIISGSPKNTVPKLNSTPDRSKKQQIPSSIENSITALKSNTSASKSNSISDRTKNPTFKSPVEYSNAVPKPNTSNRRKESISQSSTENLSSTPRSDISSQSKKSTSQSSTENSQVPAEKLKSVPSTKISNITVESSNIPDQTEKSIQDLTQSSSISAAKSAEVSNIDRKSVPQDSTNCSNISVKSQKILDNVEKSAAEDSTISASESRKISDNIEKSEFQESVESSSVPAPDSDIIFDHAEKSAKNLSLRGVKLETTSDETIETVPEIPTADDVIPNESQSEPELGNEKLTKADYKDPVDLPETNDKPVAVAHSVRRRRSRIEKIIEQEQDLLRCDLCKETFTSNRALNSHKSTHVTEPLFDSDVDLDNCKETSTNSRTLTQPALDLTPTEDAAADSSSAGISTVTDSDDDIFREYICSICGNQLASKKSLRSHRTKHFKDGEIDPELNQGAFQCPKCYKKFEKESSLRVHKAYHTTVENRIQDEIDPELNEEVFQCPKCDKKFDKERSFRVHKAYHTMIENRKPIIHDTYTDMRNGILKCNGCEREFPNERGVTKHYSYAHKDRDPSQTFPCSKCDREFNCSQGLAGHTWSAHLKRSSTNSSPYKELKNGMLECNHCGKEFETVRGFNRHYSMVHKEKDADEEEYSCLECGRTFNSSQALAGHMSAHKRGCAKNASATDDENEEEEDPEEFSCSRCDKSYSNPTSLKQHITKVHGKEFEPVSCTICEKSFASESNLKRHLRNVHDIHSTNEEPQIEKESEEEQLNDEKTYPCTDCGRVFNSYRGLNGHKQMHQRYVCEKCDEIFSNIRIYLSHMENCAVKKPAEQEKESKSECQSSDEFKCDQCDRSFPSARSLGGHKPVHYTDVSDQDEDESDVDADNEADDQSNEFKCDQCDRTFPSARSLGGHKPVHYTEISEQVEDGEESDVDADNETDDQPNEFKCDRCDRTFDNSRSLTVHLNCHISADNPQELPCPKCERVFPSFRALSVHFTNHRNEEGRSEFPCPKCKKSFNNIRSLYEHFGDVHKKVARRSSRLDSKSTFAKEPEKSDSKCTPAKEPELPDSKSIPVKELEKRSQSRGRQNEPTVPEASVDPENHSCSKCGEQFTSDRALSSHRKRCASRSKSVEDPTSPRSVKTRSKSVGDRTSNQETPTETKDVENTPNSGIRKSRRLQSFTEEVSQQQQQPQQPDEQMDVDVPLDHTATEASTQSSCISKTQINEMNDTAPKPNCDICALTFDDLKSLAKHIADSHESSSGGSMDKSFEFSDLMIRVHHCNQCDKIFHNRVGLRKHSLTHTVPLPMPWEPTFECPTCNKKFPTVIGLKRHSLVHKRAQKAAESTDDESKSKKDTATVTNSVEENIAESSNKSTEESEHLTNGVDESINDTNSNSAEKINHKSTKDGKKSSNVLDTKSMEKSNNTKKTNDAAKSTNDKTEKSKNDPETNDSKKSGHNSNSTTEKLLNNAPIVDEKSTNDENPIAVKESINDTIPASSELEDLTSPTQNDSVDHQNQSRNATGSSCDSQSDQSICDDDPNTSRLSLPIVSDEPISCLSCKICSRQFNHVKAFNKHVQWHKFNDDAVDGEETTISNDDPKQNGNPNGPLTNGNSFVELMSFVKCDICAETFKRADTLKKHAYDVHQVTITSPILYQCRSCEKAFPRGNSLFMHLKSHTDKGSDEDTMPFECASCEKCFKLKDDLLEHVKSHLNGVETDSPAEPVLNGSSDVAIVNGDNWELKINSDDLDDQNDPNVELPEETDTEEQKSQNTEPIFECSDCDKKFARKCYLSTHIRSHLRKRTVGTNKRSIKLISPPKQYKCPVCDERFRVKTSLACHIQKHSSGKVLRKSLKRPSDEKSFTAEDGVRSSKRTPKDIS